jgi:hypothetical protein
MVSPDDDFYRSSSFEGTRLRDMQGHHMHEKEESPVSQDLRFESPAEDMFRLLVWPEGTGYVILLLRGEENDKLRGLSSRVSMHARRDTLSLPSLAS